MHTLLSNYKNSTSIAISSSCPSRPSARDVDCTFPHFQLGTNRTHHWFIVGSYLSNGSGMPAVEWRQHKPQSWPDAMLAMQRWWHSPSHTPLEQRTITIRCTLGYCYPPRSCFVTSGCNSGDALQLFQFRRKQSKSTYVHVLDKL